jgi:hypothetical protein
MKRLALVALCFLLSCAGATLAGAQNWQAGMPGPVFGGPPGPGIPGPGVPGLGAPLGGPDCGASMCQPMAPCLKPPILVSSYAAWQVNNDPGNIKFSTRESNLLPLNDVGTSIQFSVNGVWVGASARVPFSDCFFGRAEGRILIPSTETATSVTQICGEPPVSRDWSSCTKYRWGVIDGSVGFNCTPWCSVLAGLRWDSFNVFLSNPTTIPLFSTIADESSLTLSAVEPYLGFEAAWVGCRGALALKAIGSPWVGTRTIFGMTFGDPTGDRLATRESTDATSKRAAFQELSLSYIFRASCAVNVGAFATVNTLWAHSENSFSSSSAQIDGQSLSQTFDIDLNRTVYMIGGTLSMAFGPFI